MAKKNVTVQVDEVLLKRSRHLAVEENSSLSEWIASLMADAVRRKGSPNSIRAKALAVLNAPLHLGGKALSREKLHER